MTTLTPISDILIYQASNGAIELRPDTDKETIWANQKQIAEIFGVDRSVITRHINNIFKDEELDKKEVSAFFAHTTPHGSLVWQTQTKQVNFYNLDMIISIGYRVNSKTATKFRQWATQTLKQHITQWYTINPSRISQNYDLFLKAVEEVKALAQHPDVSSDDVLELVKMFSQTRLSLDAFDKGELFVTEQSQQSLNIHAKELYDDILILKSDLMKRGEASNLFAQEKSHGSLEGIFGNVFQSAYGSDVYPSITSKAAHLLYFVIKNHPFTDGNKRSGAFSFIRLLQKAGYNFKDKITPEALTALTLLIATSDPSDKNRMIGLVMMMLERRDENSQLSLYSSQG